jgi:DNA sulfur modification protein DndB
MPTLENVHSTADLRRDVARRRNRRDVRSIPRIQIPQAEAEGWEVVRKSKATARVAKDKQLGPWFEDRVWTLMYRMGFAHLSGRGGAKLVTGPDDAQLSNQIDVAAIDHEVAVAIECKSSTAIARRALLQLELAKHGQMRAAFQQAVAKQWVTNEKRSVVFAFFTHHAHLSDTDRQRAVQGDVVLFDDRDLNYYEDLVSQVGPAARYQFLADLLPGKQIPGLKATFPAVRTRMGGFDCFNFAATPEFLLKISYVSHRSKGRASDVDTYQRMMRRSRLRRIAEYIEDDGIFPTNIVLSLEKDARGHLARFERAQQKDDRGEGGTFGWLHLTPSYKSAWIIDGQHRLYAYSGLAKARSSRLAVLAFVGLPADKQAQLFIDINAEQKSVKRSLLQELYAELHWNSDKQEEQINALISKAIQVLGEDRDSPLYDRIRLTESARNAQRCLSITSFFSLLDKPGFFFVSVRAGKVFEPGPMWTPGMNESLARATRILSQWFTWVRDGAPDWWALGAERPDGGLAMNDGIAVCLHILRSAFEALAVRGARLPSLSVGELIDELRPYGEALGHHFGHMTAEQRQNFRELRGSQGHTRGMRHAQRGMKERIPDFNPAGLDDFIKQEQSNTLKGAEDCIRDIETTLQRFVVERLKEEFTGGPEEWWFEGVPEQIRKAVRQRMEEEKAAGQPQETFFDLIHYRAIALKNWRLFQDALAYGKKGDREVRTRWMVTVNDLRKPVAHPSRGGMITLEQLDELEAYRTWLRGQVKAADGLDLEKPAGGHGEEPAEDESDGGDTPGV